MFDFSVKKKKILPWIQIFFGTKHHLLFAGTGSLPLHQHLPPSSQGVRRRTFREKAAFTALWLGCAIVFQTYGRFLKDKNINDPLPPLPHPSWAMRHRDWLFIIHSCSETASWRGGASWHMHMVYFTFTRWHILNPIHNFIVLKKWHFNKGHFLQCQYYCMYLFIDIFNWLHTNILL